MRRSTYIQLWIKLFKTVSILLVDTILTGLAWLFGQAWRSHYADYLQTKGHSTRYSIDEAFRAKKSEWEKIKDSDN